jgi:hypothetical protein
MADELRDWRLKKPGVHTREVHKEALPAEVVARIEALEQGIADLVAENSKQAAILADLMDTFSKHVHAPPAEMAELAQRVQALEALANKRAA